MRWLKGGLKEKLSLNRLGTNIFLLSLCLFYLSLKGFAAFSLTIKSPKAIFEFLTVKITIGRFLWALPCLLF